jgi:predicted lipid-binding transport protein (Tim44 family)
MSGPGAGGLFEAAVELHNDYYDPGDDRWRDQVATLVAELDAQVDTVRRRPPVEGAKGAADQLIIALGSAGAFQAQEWADLLSPQMQGQMQNAISGDVASHRHHLAPFLTVNDAVMASAQVMGGLEQIDVLFSISATEEDLDDRTGQVLAGDSAERSWQERWRFARNPTGDTSVTDERHEVTFARADQWMVAHRGWVVTQIDRPPAG